MVAFVFVAALVGQAAPSDPPAAPIKLLVLELEALSAGTTADVARSVNPIVLGAVTVDGVEVISQGEIKKLAELDATRAELGCDTSSCLAELAGALGARLVLFGTLSQLGESTTVSLSLFDSATTTIERDTVTVTSVGRLADDVPPRVRALIARNVAVAAAATTAPRQVEPMDLSPLYYAGLGGVVVGGAAVLAGGTVALLNEIAIQDPNAIAATKRNAQQAGVIGLGVAGVGVAMVGAGALLLVVVE